MSEKSKSDHPAKPEVNDPTAGDSSDRDDSDGRDDSDRNNGSKRSTGGEDRRGAARTSSRAATDLREKLFDIASKDTLPGLNGTLQMLKLLWKNPWGQRILVYCAGIFVLAGGILLWPQPTGTVVSRIVGLGVGWMGAGSVLLSFTERDKRRALVMGLAVIAIGLVLFVWGSDSPAFAARVLGVAVLLFGFLRIRSLYKTSGMLSALALGFASLAIGLMFLLLADNLILFVLRAVAFAWAGLAFFSLVVLLDPSRSVPVRYSTLAGLVGQWLDARTQSAADRRSVYDKVIFEGHDGVGRTRQFYVLMGFASVIASLGILSDSTAVVIGAMLIAPLMTPLMGTAVSLTMGWPKRLRSEGTLVLGGIAVGIGIGALTSLMSPTVVDTVNNSQIASRSNPTLLDLFIAIAAGGAGAFSLSRKESSGSLPGVAVAIALVPPLAVTGICWSQSDWGRGTGALLLFATNALAIILVGGFTFVLTGVAPLHRVSETKNRMRTAAVGFAVAAAVVVSILMLNGSRSASNLLGQARAEKVAQEWVDQSKNHRLERVILSEDQATVVITGTQSGVPSVQQLADDLSQKLGRSIKVDLRTILEDRYQADGSQGSGS